MNLLDENIRNSERQRLLAWRIRVRQIGREVGRVGMGDDEILAVLRSTRRITFLTQDIDYRDPGLCHQAYCLVYLDVDEDLIAQYIRRVLRHPDLNTQAKRMGTVIHVSAAGLRVWRRHGNEESLDWA